MTRDLICPYCGCDMCRADHTEVNSEIVCSRCAESFAAEAVGQFIGALWTPELEQALEECQ